MQLCIPEVLEKAKQICRNKADQGWEVEGSLTAEGQEGTWVADWEVYLHAFVKAHLVQLPKMHTFHCMQIIPPYKKEKEFRSSLLLRTRKT